MERGRATIAIGMSIKYYLSNPPNQPLGAMRSPALTARDIVRQRRSRGDALMGKRAFTLHADVIAGVKEAVGQGFAQNQSAFVEEAIREKLQRTKLAHLNDAYAQAAVDPAFLAEMDSISALFDSTASDGLSSPSSAAR